MTQQRQSQPTAAKLTAALHPHAADVHLDPLRADRRPEQLRLRWAARLDRLLHSDSTPLIQFAKISHHALPRTARRAIALHQGPIGVPLPVLGSVAAPHIHDANLADLFSLRKRVGLHYTPLPQPSTRLQEIRL